jgi:hypothetical protein
VEGYELKQGTKLGEVDLLKEKLVKMNGSNGTDRGFCNLS